MNKLVLAGVAVLAVACGSSDAGSKTGLDGTWQVALAKGCFETLVFDGSKFSDNVLCTLNNGNYGTQIEDGTFSTSGNQIDFIPVEASCPSAAHASTAAFSVQGQQLVIGVSGSQIVFEKLTPTTVPGGAVIEDGCWDSTDSNFTQQAVQTL
jgi:hypothetical protein